MSPTVSDPPAVVCPKCSARGDVYDSRERGTRKWRRRRCDFCGHRWTTIEIHMKEWNRLRRVADALGAALEHMEAGDNDE